MATESPAMSAGTTAYVLHNGYVGVTAGVMVVVLMTLLGLTAGITTGVVLRRTALKNRTVTIIILINITRLVIKRWNKMLLLYLH